MIVCKNCGDEKVVVFVETFYDNFGGNDPRSTAFCYLCKKCYAQWLNEERERKESGVKYKIGGSYLE